MSAGKECSLQTAYIIENNDVSNCVGWVEAPSGVGHCQEFCQCDLLYHIAPLIEYLSVCRFQATLGPELGKLCSVWSGLRKS